MAAFDPAALRVDYADPTTQAAADSQAKSLLAEQGGFVARGLFEKDALGAARQDIQRLIQLRCNHARLTPEPESDNQTRFDDGFIAMNRASRAHGGVIYDACRRLMPVHHLATHFALQRLSKRLMSTETLIACTLNAVRIDHPNEDKYLFLWHQDYPYIQDSEDGLVYWIPLHDVDEENGCLRLALGSHKRGVLPVRVTDPGNKNRNGARTIELADEAIAESFPQVSVPVRAGEVLVFSTLMLHRSQPNRSARARWTLQIRHGNFEHPQAIARNWPGGMIENVGFEQSHPEYVANLDALRQAA